LGPITDVHIKNAKLEEKIFKMEKELEKAKKNADLAKYNKIFDKDLNGNH